MTYSEAIEYLYSSRPPFHQVGAEAYKPGLENTLRLMAQVGNPHLHLKAIHVAGTNGKGSTSHLIAAALQFVHFAASGVPYRTDTYQRATDPRRRSGSIRHAV